VPELTIHHALERLRHDLLDDAIRRLRGEATTDGAAGEPGGVLATIAGSTGDSVRRDVQEVVDAKTWTYDGGTVSSVLGTWLLPLVPLVVNSFVRRAWE